MTNKILLFLILVFISINSFADSHRDNYVELKKENQDLIEKTKRLEEQISDLDNRMTNAELSNLMNNLNFYGSFASSMEFLDIDSVRDGKNTNKVMKGIMQLNMKSNINPRLQFYGGMIADYFWNDDIYTNQSNSNGNITDTKGPMFFLSRAYFNYSIDDQWKLTIGRIPGAFGPPEHIKNDEQRTGTFTTHSFSLFTDVVSASWTTKGVFSEKDPLSIRFIYTPMISVPRQYSLISANSSSFATDNTNIKNHEAWSLMMEHDTGKTSWFNNLSTIIQAHYIKFGAITPIQEQGVLRGQEISAGQTIVEDTSQYELSFDREDMSDMIQLTNYFEFSNILKTNTDFYFSYQRQWIHDKGNVNLRRTGNGVITDNLGNDLSSVLTAGNSIISQRGFITDRRGRSDAESILTGFKKKVNDKTYFGAEWSYLSKRGISFAVYNNLAFNHYQLNGKGGHLYWGYKPFANDSLTFRMGYQRSDMDASTINNNSDQTIDSVYLFTKINF